MNYWLLFIEFLNHFKDISYKEIPLPLLSDFLYLNPEINNLINDIKIKESLSVHLISRSEIQPYFDEVMNLITPSTIKKGKNGKIAINPIDIRLPKEFYLQHFDPDKTIVISNGNIKQKLIPSSYTRCHLNKDPLITKDSKERIISQVKQKFSELNHHPIFKNKDFQKVFLNEIPKMVDTLEAVEKFFDENPIACILVGYTLRMFPRILTLVGRKYGIPSICFQHGNIGAEAAFLPIFTTKYFVHGEIEKQWYINRGVKEHSIEITGHPRFDPIITSQPVPKEKFIEMLKLNPENNTILVITQPKQEKVFAEIIEKLVSKSELNIIIKPHQFEVRTNRCNLYHNLSQKYPFVKVVTSQFSLYNIIPNSDLVILTTSTVGLETMLFKKPILILDVFPNDYYKLYLKESVNIYLDIFLNDYYKSKEILRPYIFSTIDQLVNYSDELLSSETVKQEFELKRIEFLKIAYPQHLSGERVSNLVNKLIKEDS